MEISLSNKQALFCLNISKLIQWAYLNGYSLTFGDAYRTPTEAANNATKGSGISHSLHCIRLAIDLNLFIRGQYLPTTLAHKPLGEYWKTLHPLNRWGGDFSKPDGNHYSMEHDGIK
jgi:hypothetical protein